MKVRNEFHFENPRPIFNDYSFSKAICPRPIKVNENGFLLFFAGETLNTITDRKTNIYCLYSNKLTDWKILKKSPIINFPQPARRVLAPDIIQIDHKFHLFFEVRNGSLESIYHAWSKNLNDWSYDRKPILKGGCYGFGTPFVRQSNKGGLEIFYHRRDSQSCDIWKSQIIDLESGLISEKASRIIAQNSSYSKYSAYSPFITEINGKSYLFYAGWRNGENGGRIFYQFLDDKMMWKSCHEEVDIPITSYNRFHSSEPSLLVENNQLHIFFEGCGDDRRWRILHKKQK